MIEVKHLTKKYGKFIAVDSIDMIAENGQITMLLGPNGAGKSTTMKSIASLLKYEGEILIDGYPSDSIEAKKHFGYISELPSFYELLTVEEHLNFIQKAYQIPDDQAYRESLLKRFDLWDNRNKIAKDLSKGMTQKLSFCCALLIKPNSLLVDEPMIGLDPVAISEVLDIFKDLRAQGKAILMSTHIIDMVAEIWDVAYIMNKGKIVRRVQRNQLQEGENLKEIFFECVGKQHE